MHSAPSDDTDKGLGNWCNILLAKAGPMAEPTFLRSISMALAPSASPAAVAARVFSQ